MTASDHAAEEGASLPAVIQSAMAGRWRLATALGLLLGLLIGGVAYVRIEREYTARGWIQVISDLTPVFRGTPENSIANLDAFMETEFRNLSSESVFETAHSIEPDEMRRALGLAGDADNPRQSLRELGWESVFETRRRLDDGLKISRPGRRSTIIVVEYASPDRSEAFTAVQAVLAAYQTRFGNRWTQEIQDTRRRLEDAKSLIERDLSDLRQNILEMRTEEPLLADARSARLSLVDDLDILEDQLAELDEIIAARQADEDGDATGDETVGNEGDAGATDDATTDDAGAATAEGDSGEAGDAGDADGDQPEDAEATEDEDIRDPTWQELDAVDPELRRLRSRRDLLASSLESARGRWREGNPFLRRIEADFDEAVVAYEKARSDAEATWRERFIEARAAEEADRPVELDPLETMSLDELLARRQVIAEERDETDTRLRALARKEADIAGWQAEIDVLTQRDAGLAERLNNLRLETERDNSTFSRVNVNAATRPIAPSSDKRIKFAAAGLFGGVCMGFGLVFLLGSLDRRAFGTEQFKHLQRRYSLLGAVPDMDRRTDEEVDPQSLAAGCIHQVRNRIDSLRPNEESLALAVSSPRQGDGKTSIALALAHSYARAGFRTLAVDTDFIGEGLTTASGHDGEDGLREVLVDGALNGQIIEGPVDRLDILTAGSNTSIGPEDIRRKDLEQVVRELRAQYDVVVLDAGPMPGSIESIPVARAVDGVLVVLRRGRQTSLLDNCIDAIQESGGNVIGVVLNCALPADCERLVSASAVSLPVQDGRRRRLSGRSGRGGQLSAAMSQPFSVGPDGEEIGPASEADRSKAS